MSMTRVSSNFSFCDLLEHMIEKDVGVGHLEQITITTETQRITLVVGVKDIEDISPKLYLVPSSTGDI